MKQLLALSAFAVALGITPSVVSAQSTPPALPSLTQSQSQELAAQMEGYRRATDERVARNEISSDEAARLVQWREWQIARQIATARSAPMPTTAGAADGYPAVPPDYHDENVPPDYHDGAPPDYDSGAPRDHSDINPAPAYVPYYPPAAPYYPYSPYYPYYYGPRPYAYWGPSVCAGGFGRHFGGRVCF